MTRGAEALRWGACLALALGLHAGGAAALLARWSDDSDLVTNAPVIMLELAPVAAAPEITPTEMPPDTVQSAEAEPTPEPPKPIEKVEIPPNPAPEPQLAMLPPPKPEEPKETKKPAKKRSVARAPTTAEQRAERAAAPAPGAASHNPNALPSWKSQLVAQLERHKRFSGTDRGIVQVAFSVDRSGGVHHARVVASSGSSVLDREALALLERAQPMPPPPVDLPGAQIPVVVPLRYNYR